jgi:prevent-host-death family protein
MSTHDVAEAEHDLSDLIDQALNGEAVVITRDGRPVAEIRPVKTPKRHTAKEALAWLETRRVKLRSEGEDPVALVSRMRDEDWP